MSLISKILGFFTNKKKIQETITVPEKIEPVQAPEVVNIVESTVEEVKSEVPTSVVSNDINETVGDYVNVGTELSETSIEEVSEKPKIVKKTPSKQKQKQKQPLGGVVQTPTEEVITKALTAEEKVISAIKALKEAGNVAISISNIVKTSGVSRPTVQKYVKTLPEEYKILVVKVKG